MTMVPLTRGAPHAAAPLSRPATLATLLLGCGLISSVTYAVTDLLGGLSYPGYSFSAQAISELGAIGAPSVPIVKPLYVAYNLLSLLFGVGVMWHARHGRALRAAGAMLIAYGAVGLAVGPFDSQFAMHQRGSATMGQDWPHIALTGVFVALQFLATGLAAYALGRRFRFYSVATIATLVVLGVVMGNQAQLLAAGEPTPVLGIIERVMVYAWMLWAAVFAVVLMRRDSRHEARRRRAVAVPRVEGSVSPGFEEVRWEFERNFAERGEIGGAVAAYWRGEKVVDLWGGRRTPDGEESWTEDTMVVVMSTTKGLAAMTLAVANSRGWLDYDAPVARYWPEFAQHGKSEITVRQLLGHEAGLVLLDEPFPIERLRDLDDVARLLERQRPAWPPGTRHGYHALTIGLYAQEIIRRVDPKHRTLGRFFREEIAERLGVDFHIGLPREIPDERLARFRPLSPMRALKALRHCTPALMRRILWPWSLLRRSMAIPTGADFNDRRSLEVELPAGNGVGTARAIARAYSAFAEGGAELGITPATLARVTAPPDFTRPMDVVLGVPAYYSLGWLRPGPELAFGSSPRAFGTPGAGGSFGFADPDAHLGYAYVTNKLDFYLVDDPREKALRVAIYRAVERSAMRGMKSREADDSHWSSSTPLSERKEAARQTANVPG